MSNVVHLTFPSRAQTKAARHLSLLENFAYDRRVMEDVFWLKENAELLNIMECTGTAPDAAALETHRMFYDTIEKRMGFFPQYYRFLLSICLDLEDMGLAGTKGEKLVNWVADQGLARAEMSDLQRAEARRLMRRRGRESDPEDIDLDRRLHDFISRPETFAVPNKKAAYELTHVVFYLSEYGRVSPNLTEEAKNSLIFAGTLSYLDQNADLLAEVCVAMRQAGLNPPAIWEAWLDRVTTGFVVAEGDRAVARDDYHEFLVCNWARAAAGGEAFDRTLPHGRASYHLSAPAQGPLRTMSECMFRLDDRRSDDWECMRPHVLDALTDDGRAVLESAEAACDDFGSFFAGFARTGMRPSLELSA